MGRSIRSKKQIGADTRKSSNKKKQPIKEFMQYKIATQVRSDAAFIKSKKK